MSKTMTAEQIEETITQAHADVIAVLDVTREQRVIDSVITRTLRGVFVAGRDQGQAMILERAETLMGDNVASAQDAQMGRATLAILAWMNARAGRQFCGTSNTHASVLVADGEEQDGFHFHYEHGDSAAEALAKLATWCAEDSKKRDTMPAPAPLPSEPTIKVADTLPTVDLSDDEVVL